MFREFTVIRFTANGREYDVDERLIDPDRTAPSRTEPDIHHIWFRDGETHFRATHVQEITVIRQCRPQEGNQ